MSNSPDVKLEIGHVLFIDIVGYSKLLINEQSEQIQKLKQIVRGTEEVRKAETEGKLLRLPTGDGGALVFRNSPEAPVLCAMEISRELKKHSELRVRMGIHSGPVNEVTDLNEQANIAGVGINMAQRVMDCGDAGHILLSKRVADDLEQYPQWRSHLADLGECEVKHGNRVSVVNLYTDEVGNPQVPEKFRTAQQIGPPVPATSIKRAKSARVEIGISVAAVLLIAVAIVAVIFTPAILRPRDKATNNTKTSAKEASTTAVPAKSIAVLPFDNLSRDPDNAYFCEGVQDEILTRLAKVADLKVISRTSTQHFKSTPDNLPQIAKQLGVAHILEGSVQKASDQVRVNVQLINALTDAHLWADTYDRKLTDIFAVESEIAKTIAETLQARLSGSEKSSIVKAPTANPEAYELYLKGRFFWNKRTGNDLKTAADYFQRAIDADPSYANAYAGLAQSYLLIPLFGAGTPRDFFPKASDAAKRAIELDETSAEGHAALANLYCMNDFNPPASEKEYQRAITLDPNYATAHHWFSNSLLVSMGRFDEAIKEGKRAVELDPLSLIINADLGSTLMLSRRYDDAIAQLRVTLALDPNFAYAHWNLGEALYLKGDSTGAIAEYEKAVSLDNDPEIQALLARTYAETGNKERALEILRKLSETAQHQFVRGYLFALIYIGLGNKTTAIQYLERCFQERENIDLNWIKVDPLLDPLRGDPRFEALVERIVPALQFKSATASK